ncbi:MAG TPA: DNA-3-methyladenine glycosylase [Myxococcales bacterium]|nr:DNA-3-methyladenine glycosylase [Myxococcales bacterium]HIN86191.1 DNA-3-methyladenine glycosylase [Myxococcales bacterium]
MTPYGPDFYLNDPLFVARNLLGSLVVHAHPERGTIIGRIVETEAYRGTEDLACHASKGRTARTEVMFGPPGRAYVYLIYGMYEMLNFVTWPKDTPAAVLIRGIEPVKGIERTSDGPGKLTKALGITRELNGISLEGPRLFAAPDLEVMDSQVKAGPRIGVDYAGEWAQRPWRFLIKNNNHVSRPR